MSGFNMGMNSFCAVLADYQIWRINGWWNNEGGLVHCGLPYLD